jgi:uncharacterized protein
MADVTHVPERSRFVLEEDGDTAVLTYETDDEGPGGPRVVFLHTVVPDSMGGRGVGGRLAEAGVRWAREQRLAVVPECPFVRSGLEKHPDALAG